MIYDKNNQIIQYLFKVVTKMATGITKREQVSDDAIYAEDISLETLPLPDDKDDIEITYTNKLPEHVILNPYETHYFSIDRKNLNSNLISSIPINSFILTDNFLGLHSLLKQKNKVTLFYLDPPYGTGFDFHSRNLEHAYKDSMGKAPYLEFMRRRLILMRECLSDDGSIYIHIGHQMVSHLKIIMDEIFGSKNFRNIITRRKCSSKNFTKKQYSNLNDYILFYSKSNNYKWNQPAESPSNDWIEKEYPKIDENGRRFKLVPIHAPGTRNGETGKKWRGKFPPQGKHWQYTPDKLDELDRNGDIHWSKNNNPRRKVYWFSDKKIALTDYWEKYRDAHHQSIKITGYPTEKNYEMLKMIVDASSDKGDLVVDPFCGSGTTIYAACELQRNFIGIDSSLTSGKATLSRFRQGVKAMGDYVKIKNIESPALFDLKEIHNKEIEFVVDKYLFDKYYNEIITIAKI